VTSSWKCRRLIVVSRAISALASPLLSRHLCSRECEQRTVIFMQEGSRWLIKAAFRRGEEAIRRGEGGSY
jgi:hypothetical protein